LTFDKPNTDLAPLLPARPRSAWPSPGCARAGRAGTAVSCLPLPVLLLSGRWRRRSHGPGRCGEVGWSASSPFWS